MCETVIISDKAYNAMIRESFAKHPVETGGILLGYILDNGIWVVMEMIPPGINGVFEPAYFEYDQNFVNYLGTSVANQYKEPLQVLGLWHRHPGSMDYFSSTDDGTNSEFASRNPFGVISGLVNIDPAFRLTMYHLAHNPGTRPRNIAYSTVDVEVGDDLIPERFFELRYVDGERSELHPTPTRENSTKSHSVPKSTRTEARAESEYPSETYQESAPTPAVPPKAPKKNFPKWGIALAGVLLFLAGLFTGKMWGGPSEIDVIDPNYELDAPTPTVQKEVKKDKPSVEEKQNDESDQQTNEQSDEKPSNEPTDGEN